jgi:NADH-quinone oxidoreductase subunit L
VFDLIYNAVAAASRGLNRLLSRTETGRLRWYAGGIAVGAVIILAIAVLR